MLVKDSQLTVRSALGPTTWLLPKKRKAKTDSPKEVDTTTTITGVVFHHNIVFPRLLDGDHGDHDDVDWIPWQ